MESRKNFDLWAVIYDFIESRFPWIAKVFFESDSKGCKDESLEESAANTAKPVSYTHLTLPTKRIV